MLGHINKDLSICIYREPHPFLENKCQQEGVLVSGTMAGLGVGAGEGAKRERERITCFKATFA